MAEKYKKTLLLVTHDMTLAEKGSAIYRITPEGVLVKEK